MPENVTVRPGDTYTAHVGGYGNAGPVAASITVHQPTGRVVDRWIAEDVVSLGEPVSDLAERGYTVTPREVR